MLQLILATEATTAPPGDDIASAAYLLLGIALVVTAIATIIVTPKADPHH